MRTILFVLAVAAAAPLHADVVPPDCVPRFPAEEMDSCARDRAVVIFHNACGTALSKSSCHIRANPGVVGDCEQLKSCMHAGENGTLLGGIAGHVLDWQLKHHCEGNQKCIAVHDDICRGRGDKLQQRRRLLRCSQKARNKLNDMSAQVFQAKTGTGQDGKPVVWDGQFGRKLAEEVASAPAGAAGGPPGPVGGDGAAEPGERAPAPASVSAEEFERKMGACLDQADASPDQALACLRGLRAELRERGMRSTEGSRTR